MNNLHKCSLILNMNVYINSEGYTWNDLLSYLGIKATETDSVKRFTPDDECIRYDKEYAPDVEYLCNYYNCVLNKRYPFQYPENWFEVIKILITLSGGPIGCDGKYLAGYMFAAPRKYLSYFVKGKPNKDIALEIFYDNL